MYTHENGDPCAIELPPDYGHSEAFWKHLPINDWNPKSVAYYSGEELPEFDCHSADVNKVVVSDEFARFVMKQAPNAMQYLPMRLQNCWGAGEILGFGIAHVIRVVDCIDRERTELDDEDEGWNREPYGSFRICGELVLSESKIGDESLFLVDGYTVVLCMREDLAMAIGHQFPRGSFLKEMQVV